MELYIRPCLELYQDIFGGLSGYTWSSLKVYLDFGALSDYILSSILEYTWSSISVYLELNFAQLVIRVYLKPYQGNSGTLSLKFICCVTVCAS